MRNPWLTLASETGRSLLNRSQYLLFRLLIRRLEEAGLGSVYSVSDLAAEICGTVLNPPMI
jgi:hypothetical protein